MREIGTIDSGRFGDCLGRRPGTTCHDIDQVTDDGRCSRHGACPSAVEQGVADGVTHDANRVIGPAYLRQRPPALHQSRGDPELEPGGRELGQREQLDDIAQLSGVLQIGKM